MASARHDFSCRRDDAHLLKQLDRRQSEEGSTPDPAGCKAKATFCEGAAEAARQGGTDGAIAVEANPFRARRVCLSCQSFLH